MTHDTIITSVFLICLAFAINSMAGCQAKESEAMYKWKIEMEHVKTYSSKNP
jgi:hypothetical protein